MLKKVLLISLLLLGGCLNKDTNRQILKANDNYIVIEQNSQKNNNFNKMIYFWEYVYFPTNRTDGVK